MNKKHITSRRAFLAVAAAVGTAGCTALSGSGEGTPTEQNGPSTTETTTAKATIETTTTTTVEQATATDTGTATAAARSEDSAETTDTSTAQQNKYSDMFTGDHFELPSPYEDWTTLGEIDVKGGGVPLYDLNGNGEAAYREFDIDIYDAIGEQYATDETVDNISLHYPGGKIRFNESFRNSEKFQNEDEEY